jgi:Methyltransferase domain
MTLHAVTDDDLYRGYEEWKGWRGAFNASEADTRYFATELAGMPVGGRRVLEIGFGNGSFLAWAKAQGAIVAGTETHAAIIDAARTKGFDAHPADLGALLVAARCFDLVVAFDVLEHWDMQTLITNLNQIHALLDVGGTLLARFPNGQSPFGRLHQYGDITHRSVLSASSIGQLAQMTGFEVVRVANAARVPARLDPWSLLKFRWRCWRRARLERAIGRLYETGRLPFDLNLTAVLRKAGPLTPT